MKDPVYLRICCHTREQARRVVALLLNRNLPAASIRLQSSEPIHELGSCVVGKPHLSILEITGAVVFVAACCAIATVTILLFPFNLMLVAMLLTLAGLIFKSKFSHEPLRHAQELVESIENGEIHVLALVNS